MHPISTGTEQGGTEQTGEVPEKRYPPATPGDETPELYRLHETEVSVPYAWLGEESLRRDEWLAGQRAYTDGALSHEAVSQRANRLAARIEELGKLGTCSVPIPVSDGKYLFVERLPGHERVGLHRADSIEGPKQTIIEEGTIGTVHPSPGGNLVAVRVAPQDTDSAYLAIRDLTSGQEIDRIPETLNPLFPDLALASAPWVKSLAWHPDGKGFWYIRAEREGTVHTHVYFHTVGTSPDQDRLVFKNDDGASCVTRLEVDSTGTFLILNYSNNRQGDNVEEPYYLKIDEAGCQPQKIPTVADCHHQLKIAGTHAYLWTTANAPNGKILKLPVDRLPEGETVADELVPETEAVIENFWTCGESVLVQTQCIGASKLTLYDAQGQKTGDVELSGRGKITSVTVSGETVLFRYSDVSTPDSLWRFTPPDTRPTCLKQISIPGAETMEFHSEVLEVPSHDGARIPVQVFRRADVLPTGAPTVLYAYGAYGKTFGPEFSAQRRALLESGVVYCIVGVRGGGERGAEWTEGGMRDNAPNRHLDLVAVADSMVTSGRVPASRIAVMGGSAAGNTILHAVLERPDLFQVALVTNGMFDPVPPDTKDEREIAAGYGKASNPGDIPCILRMSALRRAMTAPRAKLPHMILSTNLDDDRVFNQSFRAAAVIQRHHPSGGTYLYPIPKGKGGHMGSSDVSVQALESSRPLALMLDQITRAT